ncbi:hypothetical protein GJAV_G00154860 [Gymnothorax javanicus]|nr:hypothetical protein GJAV_G00154860 [Gymnothorax javanicus]
MAGKDWLTSFLERNRTLSIRRPQATSMSCSTSFNKTTVTAFFNNLKTVLTRYNFEANDIWNMDETGTTTVQVPDKVIATKGQRQAGSRKENKRRGRKRSTAILTDTPVKHTAADGIVSLGLSVINKLPAKELDKIFKNANELPSSQQGGNCTPETEDIGELLKEIANNRERIKKLENIVTTLTKLMLHFADNNGALENNDGEPNLGEDATVNSETPDPADEPEGDDDNGAVPSGTLAARSEDGNEDGILGFETDSNCTHGYTDFVIPTVHRRKMAKAQRRKEKRECAKPVAEEGCSSSLKAAVDPSMSEVSQNQVIIGASGLVLGLIITSAGVIYYKKKSTGRILVPSS